MSNLIDVIVDNLDEDELLCQFAEEASELAQAALKLRRARNQKNPTPKTAKECYDQLLEEMCDVRVCWFALGLNSDHNLRRMAEIEEKKIMRWAKRLEDKENNA